MIQSKKSVNLNREILIYAGLHSDIAIRGIILKKFQPIIFKIAARYHALYPVLEIEELIQIGYERLMICLMKWNPWPNVFNFINYFGISYYTAIKRRMKKEQRNENLKEYIHKKRKVRLYR